MPTRNTLPGVLHPALQRRARAHPRLPSSAHAPGTLCVLRTCREGGEVVEVVRLCQAHGVPITAFGGGTSTEGHITTPVGGITLDLKLMNVSALQACPCNGPRTSQPIVATVRVWLSPGQTQAQAYACQMQDTLLSFRGCLCWFRK